jgi:hypothetical protein
MKQKHLAVIAIAVGTIVFHASCAKEESIPGVEIKNRESFLDRVVFIEPEFRTEIPQVNRWCDRLKLKKLRSLPRDTLPYRFDVVLVDVCVSHFNNLILEIGEILFYGVSILGIFQCHSLSEHFR